MSARGELEFLTPSSFSNAWRIAHAQFPTLFTNTDEQVIRRLSRDARGAGTLKMWRATLPYFDRLIAHEPSDDFWRKRRALAWLNLGDLRRAMADDPEFAVLPLDPRATARQIDLSAHYNRFVENELSGLPTELREFEGKMFDVRGIVGVCGLCPDGRLWPPQVMNIRIGVRCREWQRVCAFEPTPTHRRKHR